VNFIPLLQCYIVFIHIAIFKFDYTRNSKSNAGAWYCTSNISLQAFIDTTMVTNYFSHLITTTHIISYKQTADQINRIINNSLSVEEWEIYDLWGTWLHQWCPTSEWNNTVRLQSQDKLTSNTYTTRCKSNFLTFAWKGYLQWNNRCCYWLWQR